MTTRDHVVHQLQLLYALHRDLLPMFDEMHHQAGYDPVRRVLDRQREDFRNEVERLERGLSLLGAQYKMERSAVASGFKEEVHRFKHQMNPAREQLDLHAVLDLLAIAHYLIGVYQGCAELLRTIGEQDVATLAEESRQQQQEHVRALEELLQDLAQEVAMIEARRAA